MGFFPPTVFAPPADAPALDHVRAMMTAQVAEILAHDPGTRLGRDPEELHQLRVATRRLRAVLRAARPLLDPDWTEALRDELRWLGAALGSVRDLDVLGARLREDIAALEPQERRAAQRFVQLLRRQREVARAALLEAMSEARYFELLDRLEAAAAAPRAQEADVSLRAIADGEFRKLRKAVRALPPEPTDEELHAVRIKGKRARYAADLAEGVVGKPARVFVRDAKRFQDVVGEHQDAVVAEAWVREMLPRAKGLAAHLAAGRLIERERVRRERAREAFPRTWARLAKSGRRAWA
jgi:CHAD domain-containing protein